MPTTLPKVARRGYPGRALKRPKGAAVFLGIDLGTGSVKVMLLDSQGRERLAVRSYPIESPAPGRAESDPEAWLAAIRAAVGELSPLPPLRGIGLSGQMHGVVPISREGLAPLQRAILWADQRGAPYLQRFAGLSGEMRARMLNEPAAGLTATTLLWMKHESPRDYERVEEILFPKDYIRAVLTGTMATDPSDASGSLLYDFKTRGWYWELIGALELDEEMLPEIRWATEPAGVVTTEGARRSGLPAGTLVAVGAADAPAGVYGSGLAGAAEAQLSVGTAAQISRPIPSDRLPERIASLNVFEGVLPSQRYRVAAMLNAGVALEWARGLFPREWEAVYAALESRGLAEGSDLLFLPYLTGERTPYLNPRARGAWIGLSLHHTADDLLFAALLGVACSIRLGLETLGAEGIERILAVGGSLRHLFWRRVLATVIGRPLSVSPHPDISARGAALLAAAMTGERLPVAQEPDAPQEPEEAPWVEEYYRSFREGYRALQPVQPPL